jgi:RNA polymerase primary sigma factor
LARKTKSQEAEKQITSEPGKPEDAPQNINEATLPIDEVKEILAESGLAGEGEPDDDTLSREEPNLEKIAKDEPLEILEDPNLAVELSDDPVRLYLKEIGGIALLDTDREFWLATQMEAARRVDSLTRQHPLIREGDSLPRSVYKALYEELMTAWKRVVEDTRRLGFDLPDMSLILGESQRLRQTWNSDSPSYLQAY